MMKKTKQTQQLLKMKKYKERIYRMKTKLIIGMCMLLIIVVGCSDNGLQGEEIIEATPNIDIEYYWAEYYSGSDSQTIELHPYDESYFGDLVHRSVTIYIPEDYKEEINITNISAKRKYNCIFNCPINTSLNGCEYGTCFEKFEGDCWRVTDNYLYNRCDFTLVFKISYEDVE